MISLHKLRIARNVAGIKGLMYIGPAYVLNRALPNKVKAKPRAIQVEVTNLCNLQCSMCYIHELERDTLGFLTFDEFKKIIDTNFDYWHSIKLWGIGEPFMNKDIFRMIEYESKKGRYTNISTNAQLLNEQMCQKVINSGLSRLFISIDSVDKERYEKIRLNGKFDILEHNVATLTGLIKAQKKGPVVNITTVVQKDNIDDLGAIIDFAAKYNIKKVLIQEIQLGKEGQILEEDEIVREQIIKDNLEMKEKVQKAVEYGKLKNVLVMAPEIKEKTKRESCVSPWMQAYVTKEGYITPCCRCISPKHYTCGNLFKENLDSVWNNEKYQEFRKNLREGKPLPKICQNCTML